MLKIKFFLTSPWKEIVTGGHKYDNELFGIIKESGLAEIEGVVTSPATKKNKIVTLFHDTINGIKNRKADVIVFNSSKCVRYLPLAFLLRFVFRKNIHTIHHHFIYKEFNGLKRKVFKTAESLFLGISNKIIIPSPYIYSVLLQKRKESDLLLWRIPFETKAQFTPSPKVGNLTFTGTIEPRKGLIYLLKSLKILQDAGVDYNLKIVGKTIDENYRKELESYISEHNLNAEFLGFVSKDEKNRILSQTDIFVFPSLLEGFGMVLVEAQVYGLPIVTFRNSAMPFTVADDVNGYLAATGNYNEFAQHLIKIITDRKLRNRLSEGALLNVESQTSYEDHKKTVTGYLNKLSGYNS